MLSPLPISGGEESMQGGAKRRGVPVKTLKKLLKKAGLKTSGKKAALTRRAKKARLMKGGNTGEMVADTTQIDKVKTAEEEAAEAEEEAKRKEEEAKKAEMGGRKRRKSRGKLF